MNDMDKMVKELLLERIADTENPKILWIIFSFVQALTIK